MNVSGLYKIEFSVVSLSSFNQFSVSVNSVSVAGSNYESDVSEAQINGMVLVNLNAGDLIQLENHNQVTIPGGGAVNASMMIIRVN